MLWVTCLKWGTKYSALYVNRLRSAVARHLNAPHCFVCFTDDPQGLDPEVEVKRLPVNPVITGWWWKPYVFRRNHFATGDTVLFLDLDMVIVGNLDKIVNFAPTEFVGMRDVYRAIRPETVRLGSAVMCWPANQFDDLWDPIPAKPSIITQFRGDQDWIWHNLRPRVRFLPDEWVRSYKWEVRARSELHRTTQGWQFRTTRSPVISCDTSILAFHGTPALDTVQDKIITDHWR